MTRILLTGFEPFAADPANPSGDAVRVIAERWDAAEDLTTAVLPVTFADAAATLRALMSEHSPDLVIATGLAGGRSNLSMEQVAINLREARIADNAGAQPAGVPCVPGAPDGRFTTVPVRAMRRAVRDAGIPAEVSYSAGTFVCNDVFFHALDAAPAGTRVGFIHVPWSTASAPTGMPALPLPDIARGLEIAVLTAARTTIDDDVSSSGTLH